MSDQPPATPKRHLGAKPKLTPEIQAEICEKIAAVCTLRDAALMVGVDETTVYRWVRKGEESRRGIYYQFRKAIELAKAQRRSGIKAGMRKHGARDWRALQALGAITDPDEFVPQIRVHVTSQLDGAIARLREAFADDPESYERAVHALAGGTSDARAAAHSDPEDGPDTAASGEAVQPAPAVPEAEDVS